jgi:glycosyltransferase involved in cell wall biosynthesis
MEDEGDLPTVSVIIPIWNDPDAMAGVMRCLSGARNVMEVIVGDASVEPDCREIAEAHGARVVSCPVPNRGIQMNAAVACATGDVLLFQHADTQISEAHVASLQRTMTNPAIVGGAFYRKFDPSHANRQWMERWVRQINRHGTLYGDQSVFVRRDHFEKMGRFADLPMMEDIEFSKRLRRSGKIAVIDPPLLSSARRHKAYGSIRATVENFGAIWLYKLGVSPFWIHRHYYRRNRKGLQGPPAEEVAPVS